MLRENLDELQQTVNLMQSDNHDEFYDISIRNKKYGRVDPLNGPMLLEKCVFTRTIENKTWLKQTRANIVVGLLLPHNLRRELRRFPICLASPS